MSNPGQPLYGADTSPIPDFGMDYLKSAHADWLPPQDKAAAAPNPMAGLTSAPSSTPVDNKEFDAYVETILPQSGSTPAPIQENATSPETIFSNPQKPKVSNTAGDINSQAIFDFAKIPDDKNRASTGSRDTIF